MANAALVRYGAHSTLATPGGGWGVLCLNLTCPGFWRTELSTEEEAEAVWLDHLRTVTHPDIHHDTMEPTTPTEGE